MPTMERLLEIVDAALATYTDVALASEIAQVDGLTVVARFLDAEAGVSIVAFQDASGGVLLSFAQTTTPALASDVRGWNAWLAQRDAVRSFVDSLPAGTKLDLVGHAQGGALASYAAYDLLQTGLHPTQDLILTTLNGAGGVPGLDAAGGYDPAVVADLEAYHYRTGSDVISRLAPQVGGSTYLLNPGAAGQTFLEAGRLENVRSILESGSAVLDLVAPASLIDTAVPAGQPQADAGIAVARELVASLVGVSGAPAGGTVLDLGLSDPARVRELTASLIASGVLQVTSRERAGTRPAGSSDPRFLSIVGGAGSGSSSGSGAGGGIGVGGGLSGSATVSPNDGGIFAAVRALPPAIFQALGLAATALTLANPAFLQATLLNSAIQAIGGVVQGQGQAALDKLFSDIVGNATDAFLGFLKDQSPTLGKALDIGRGVAKGDLKPLRDAILSEIGVAGFLGAELDSRLDPRGTFGGLSKKIEGFFDTLSDLGDLARDALDASGLDGVRDRLADKLAELLGLPDGIPDLEDFDLPFEGFGRKEALKLFEDAGKLEEYFDPLVLDLDGDGIETTALGSRRQYFDFDGDGTAERTGFVGADDGVLALDRDGNGRIDGLSDLFGSETQTGFAALAALDENADGSVDANDARFGELRVFRDLNQNGAVDAGELSTLAELGIRALGTGSTAVEIDSNGNLITALGTFTRVDGGTGQLGDVKLRVAHALTEYRGSTTPSAEALALPTLAGAGDLPSLAIAMTEDPSLLALVSAFAATPVSSLSDLLARGEEILSRWAGADDVALGTRGSHIDARRLAVLEKFNGTGFVGVDGSPDPNSQAAQLLERAYLKLVMTESAALFAQTDLGRDLGLVYVPEPRSITLFHGDAAALFAALGGVPEQGEAALNFLVELVPLLDAIVPDDEDAVIEAILDARPRLPTILDTAPVRALLEPALREAGGGSLDLFRQASLLKVIVDGAAGSTLSGTFNARDEAFLAGAGSDTVFASNGNDILIGGAGDDTLSGDAGNDVLSGGTGNDLLDGGSGRDVYEYARGDGLDTVRDLTFFETDRVRLLDTSASELRLERRGNSADLTVVVNEGVDELVLVDFYGNGARGIEELELSDGTVLDRAALLALAEQVGSGAADELRGSQGDDRLVAGAGNDSVLGDGGNDVLIGGAGNDQLDGSSGQDVYVFSRGDGLDRITDTHFNETDRLRLTDVTPDQVRLERRQNGDDLVVVVEVGVDEIRLSGFFSSPATGIEEIEFADGTVWSRATLVTRTLPISADGALRGGEEADTIIGTNGNDRILGLGGNDTLAGEEGNDLIVGGRGDDVLSGGSGIDTYEFSRGDGRDRIVDAQLESDRLVFLDVMAEELSFSTVAGSDDLTIRVGEDGDEVTLVGFLAGNRLGSQEIRTADGRVMKEADLLVQFQTFGTSANDVLFADSFLDRLLGDDVLAGGAGDDVLFGGVGDDVLIGNEGEDRLIGGAGDDVLDGGDGSDVYVFGREDGLDVVVDTAFHERDRVQLTDSRPGEVQLERRGSSLELTLVIRRGTDEVQLGDFYDPSGAIGIEEVELEDGTVWDRAYLLAHAIQVGDASDDVLIGYHLDDRIFGGLGDDVINGKEGNDVISGGGGDDLLDGDIGQDTYLFARGDGRDRITDSYFYTIDRLVLTDATASEVKLERRVNSSSDLTVVVTDGVDEVRLADFYVNTAIGVEEVELADGTVWDREYLASHAVLVGDDAINLLTGSNAGERIEGRGGDDTIRGGFGNDVLVGGTGNDFVDGEQGSDVFEYRRGDGLDRFVDTAFYQTDRLKLLDATADQVRIERRGNSGDLTVVIETGVDEVQLGDFYAGNGAVGIDELEFADGVVWDRAAIAAHAVQVGDEGANTLTGSNVGDRIEGRGGDDTIRGGGEADVLVGGAGNDLLEGEHGNDVYEFSRGDGLDRISDGSIFTTDRLRLTDVTASQVRLERRGSAAELTVVVESGVDEIRLDSFYANGDFYGVDELEFADGTLWNRATIGAHAIQVGGDAADTFYGSEFGERIEGRAGNDVLRGGLGNDVLVGGTGNDFLDGGQGNDAFEFSRGDGLDVIAEDSFMTTDRLELIDVTASQVKLERRGNSGGLTVVVESGVDEIRLDYFYQYGGAYGIEELALADGTVWDRAYLGAHATQVGDAFANTLNGSAFGERIEGGAGDDVLSGGLGDDVLAGGSGNDYLEGGQGSDVFEFSRGGGLDTVSDSDGSTNATDRLRLTDVRSDQLWLTMTGSALRVQVLGTNDAATLVGWTPGSATGIEIIETSDGFVLDRADVDQLLQAMAAFTPPHVSSLQESPQIAEILLPVLAATQVS